MLELITPWPRARHFFGVSPGENDDIHNLEEIPADFCSHPRTEIAKEGNRPKIAGEVSRLARLLIFSSSG